MILWSFYGYMAEMEEVLMMANEREDTTNSWVKSEKKTTDISFHVKALPTNPEKSSFYQLLRNVPFRERKAKTMYLQNYVGITRVDFQKFIDASLNVRVKYLVYIVYLYLVQRDTYISYLAGSCKKKYSATKFVRSSTNCILRHCEILALVRLQIL